MIFAYSSFSFQIWHCSKISMPILLYCFSAGTRVTGIDAGQHSSFHPTRLCGRKQEVPADEKKSAGTNKRHPRRRTCFSTVGVPAELLGRNSCPPIMPTMHIFSAACHFSAESAPAEKKFTKPFIAFSAECPPIIEDYSIRPHIPGGFFMRWIRDSGKGIFAYVTADQYPEGLCRRQRCRPRAQGDRPSVSGERIRLHPRPVGLREKKQPC